MPKLRPGQVPSLRRHKTSRRGVVTLSGKDHYLGPWPDPDSSPPSDVVRTYEKAVAEWLAAGRRASAPSPSAESSGLTGPTGVTVGELILRFWTHVRDHYRHPDGTPTSEVDNFRLSLRPILRLYETLPAAEFTPLKLKAVRQAMVDSGLNRRTVNQRVGRVVRMFKWAVAEELVPVATYQALRAVPGFRRGGQRPRAGARRTGPRRAHRRDLVPPVAGGGRHGPTPASDRHAAGRGLPAAAVRPGPVGPGVAVPADHKMGYRGRGRTVAIGPQAQQVLAPWLGQPGLTPEGYVFSPSRAMAAFRARQRAAGKNKGKPLGPGKRKPRKRPGERYTTRSYSYAVAQACEKAGVPGWHPNQLRHSYATEVRRRHGLEAGQVALGHSKADVTQVYAERDLALAVRVAAEVG
jgi:integrase